MEVDELLNIFHVLVHRKLHLAENAGYHFGSHGIVAVEGPPQLRVEALRHRFGYVVEQRPPPEPHIVARGGNVVEHRHRVVEIILVPNSFDHLHAAERSEFGQNQLEKPRLEQQLPTARRLRRPHDFHQLVGDAFARNNRYAPRVAAYCLESIVDNREPQLGGEAYGAHHAQRVVGEGYVGVERRAYQSVAQVGHAVVFVDELAEAPLVDAHRHGVDGEVAAGEVVVEGAILDNRFPRVALIRLPAGSHELQLHPAALDLGSAEILEHGDMGAADAPADGARHLDAAPDGYEIDILRFAVQENVAHIATHGIAFAAELVGHGSHGVEHGLVNLFDNHLLISQVIRFHPARW